MYNPFVIFTEEVLKSLQNDGINYLIVQRFDWPGLNRSESFIIIPYSKIESANEHEQQLREKEGKLFDISKDFDKVNALLDPDKGFRLYFDKFKETNWNKRMLREYERNIVNYLRSRTQFTREDSIDINFVLHYGRLIAQIRATGKSLDVPAFDLIK